MFARKGKLAKYSLTEALYQAMVDAQGGGCGICGETLKMDRFTHVDHDHTCPCSGPGSCGGCVRSVLCHGCNIGIGNMRDDPALLRRAADYIELHRQIESKRTQL